MKYLQISLVSCMSIYNPIFLQSHTRPLHYTIECFHRVTVDILVSQNNEKAAMLVSNLVGVELFSYVNRG